MYKEYYVPSHEITPLTLAVIPHQDENKRITGSRIMEKQSEFIVDHIPTKVIDEACQFFGADLKGMQAGTKKICRITHKAPICISAASGMYFFPTSSPANANCSWIAHSHISHMNSVENQFTEVVFKSGQRIIVEVSYGSMVNQLQRTAQFRYLLDNRINYLLSYQTEDRTDHIEDPKKPYP